MRRLQHKSGLNDIYNPILSYKDGLIFTSVPAAYIYGTNHKMLKWKSSEENSVDFRVVASTLTPKTYELMICGNDRDEYKIGDLIIDAQLAER